MLLWRLLLTYLITLKVVLSDGAIVNENADENSDLFWALKGGGPNFGIVTRFDLYTVPVKEIWYELRVYSVDDLSSVIGNPLLARSRYNTATYHIAIADAFVQWLREGSADFKSTASLIMKSIICNAYYWNLLGDIDLTEYGYEKTF